MGGPPADSAAVAHPVAAVTERARDHRVQIVVVGAAEGADGGGEGAEGEEQQERREEYAERAGRPADCSSME